MTQPSRPEQSLQSPASRLPSLQHLIHTNSTTRLGDDSSNGCNSPHATTDGATGATIGVVRPQSFSQHNPAYFSPRNSAHGARGSRTACGLESRQESSVTVQPQWMADFRRPSPLPSAARGDIQSLTSYQPCPQPNYDLTEVTTYGSALSDLDFTTYEPLSDSQMNYNLTEVTPYGSSRQIDLDEACPQRNINYSLTEVTRYGIFPFNSLNRPRSPRNISYSLTEVTPYGSALSQSELEPHTHFPTLRTTQ